MGDFPCNQAENLVDNKMDLAQLLNYKLYQNQHYTQGPLELSSQLSPQTSQSQGVDNNNEEIGGESSLQVPAAAVNINSTCPH